MSRLSLSFISILSFSILQLFSLSPAMADIQTRDAADSTPPSLHHASEKVPSPDASTDETSGSTGAQPTIKMKSRKAMPKKANVAKITKKSVPAATDTNASETEVPVKAVKAARTKKTAVAKKLKAEAQPIDHGVVSADTSLKWLTNGNIRFVKKHFRADGKSPADRKRLITSQNPHAIVLACSDSRVPPELVFDQGLGEIYVVRVAGEVIDDSVLATIEHAVQTYGPQLLVVMGHTQCDAVQAAMERKDHSATNESTPHPGHAIASERASTTEDDHGSVEATAATTATPATPIPGAVNETIGASPTRPAATKDSAKDVAKDINRDVVKDANQEASKEAAHEGNHDNLDKLLASIQMHLKTLTTEKPSPGLQVEATLNADGVARELVQRSEVLRKQVEAGKLVIRPALYRLDTGAVSFY